MIEEQLKQIRAKKNLSLEQLSTACKLPESYLRELEEGKTELTKKALSSLLSVLSAEDGIDLDISVSGLGDRIRAMREEKNQTLESFSKALGLSTTYISEIERGERAPSVQTLQKISSFFDVPVSLFIDSESKLVSLGKKIKMTREMKGLSQKQLAAAADISPGMVAQLETGKVQPSLKTVEKVAEAMGVSTCYLILEQLDIEGIIAGVGQDLRELLFEPKVQMIIGHICTLNKEQLRLVLNFIQMIKNPVV